MIARSARPPLNRYFATSLLAQDDVAFRGMTRSSTSISSNWDSIPASRWLLLAATARGTVRLLARRVDSAEAVAKRSSPGQEAPVSQPSPLWLAVPVRRGVARRRPSPSSRGRLGEVDLFHRSGRGGARASHALLRTKPLQPVLQEPVSGPTAPPAGGSSFVEREGFGTGLRATPEGSAGQPPRDRAGHLSTEVLSRVWAHGRASSRLVHQEWMGNAHESVRPVPVRCLREPVAA